MCEFNKCCVIWLVFRIFKLYFNYEIFFKYFEGVCLILFRICSKIMYVYILVWKNVKRRKNRELEVDFVWDFFLVRIYEIVSCIYIL